LALLREQAFGAAPEDHPAPPEGGR
jgi:hypothetical protein